ncbi:hypothetical protein [Sinorhizobium medicae]|uniref:hypothetical protein n=1 Tax=Sinorhizobium medicae TaxID=110321 RepID=UPI000FDC73E3|nr:hypothetical protein [Sinorhizobium medicae]RVP50035.1 hypothetical protein CN078_21595 [Sinorhizobium medicae]RVP74845.1 hypothetical protein CN079_20950 [Sinorhizobium medicae]UWU09431.1 hypothetical protein N2598_06730 [Sinorhizobium medicae]
MDQINSILTNPMVGIPLSLFLSLLVAKYSYKINSLNKARLKNYFFRRIARINVVLFERRDAFFADFIFGIAMVILSGILVASFSIVSIFIHKDIYPNPTVFAVMNWLLIAFIGILGAFHFKVGFRLMSEMTLLSNPTYAVDRLRKEIHSQDTRELLDAQEIETFTKLLDIIAADIPALYGERRGLDLYGLAKEPEPQTPPLSEEARPAQ